MSCVANFDRPWLWWPIIVAIAISAIRATLAYHFASQYTYPRKARASGFTGNVRDAAQFTLFGSGAGLLASLLTKELEGAATFRDATLSILLISLLASILNYWMASSLDTRLDDDGKSVELSGKHYEVVHGIISGLSIAAICSLFVFIAVYAVEVG